MLHVRRQPANRGFAADCVYFLPTRRGFRQSTNDVTSRYTACTCNYRCVAFVFMVRERWQAMENAVRENALRRHLRSCGPDVARILRLLGMREAWPRILNQMQASACLEQNTKELKNTQFRKHAHTTHSCHYTWWEDCECCLLQLLCHLHCQKIEDGLLAANRN